MNRTVKFETYAREVVAIQYDGTLECVAAINDFSGYRLHLRYATDVVFMTEFGLVAIKSGDWIVEIAEGRFVPMKDETRKMVFCPHTLDYADAEDYAANALGASFAGDIGEVDLNDGPLVPRRESVIEAGEFLGNHDQTMIVIREDHPHSALINTIVARTGIKNILVEGQAELATGQPFETALTALKMGYRVAREGWNGQAWLCQGEGRSVGPEGFWNKHTKAFAEARRKASFHVDNRRFEDVLTEVSPYIVAVETSKGKVSFGYSLEADDVLGSDWIILED